MSLPELVAELALGLGAALFGANALVLYRSTFSKRKGRGRGPKPPSPSRVMVNMAIGAAVAVWGLASLLNQR